LLERRSGFKSGKKSTAGILAQGVAGIYHGRWRGKGSRKKKKAVTEGVDVGEKGNQVRLYGLRPNHRGMSRRRRATK